MAQDPDDTRGGAPNLIEIAVDDISTWTGEAGAEGGVDGVNIKRLTALPSRIVPDEKPTPENTAVDSGIIRTRTTAEAGRDLDKVYENRVLEARSMSLLIWFRVNLEEEANVGSGVHEEPEGSE